MPIIPIITQDQTSGELGRMTAFTANTQAQGNGTCPSPVIVRLDWTNNGSVTDDYQVKLYMNKDPVEYPSTKGDLIRTENSPATTSLYDANSLTAYNAAGPRWFYLFTAELYGPSGVLLQTLTDIYSTKGYDC